MKLRTILLGTVASMMIAAPVSAKDHRVVMTDDMAREAQAYLEQQGVLEPSANMNQKISRGEFVRQVVELLYKKDMNLACFDDIGSYPDQPYTKLFRDESRDGPMAIPLCVALKVGIARGRPDGSFHSDATIRSSEAAWIIYKAYDIGPLDRQNLPRAPWYSHVLYDVDQATALDASLLNPAHELSMAEAAEVLFRLRKKRERLVNPVLGNDEPTAPLRLLGNEAPKSDIQSRTLNSQEGVMPGVERYRARGIDFVVPRRTRTR